MIAICNVVRMPLRRSLTLSTRSVSVVTNNRFVFIGAPGVGKGTFANIICSRNGWSHLSLGDILRAEVKQGSPIGNKLNQYMSKGLLVPDDIANEIMLAHICKNASNGFILDGYPRTVNQAEFLEKNMPTSKDMSHSEHITAVNITLAEWVAVEKLLARSICATCGSGFNTASIMSDGYDMPAILPDKETCMLGSTKCNPVLTGRSDDSPDVIKRRFEEHTLKTKPLLDFYSSRDRLKNFDVKKGVKDTDALFAVMTATDEVVHHAQ